MRSVKILLLTLVIGSAYTLNGCCNAQQQQPASPQVTTAACKSCDTSCLNQSPINIIDTSVGDSSAQPFTPAASLLYITAQPVTVKFVKFTLPGFDNMEAVPATAANNFIMLNGEHYNLVKFHFHAPSEHAINAARADMEMHLVYAKPGTTQRAIIGILINATGPDNPFITKLWSGFQHPADTMQVDMPALQLSTKLSSYYTYTGSLTVPTYQEGATWFVSKYRITVSPAQLKAFQSMHYGSARALQPRNNRIIFKTKN